MTETTSGSTHQGAARPDNYAFRVKLNLPYEQTMDKVTAALKEQGFGVLTKIDVKETMKQKLDADFRKYVILGACNPPLAHKALSTQLNIGLLLPCNVIVYEEDGGSVVEILDPIQMMGIGGNIAENPELKSVADEAQTRLQRVAINLETK
jgi:uncharacterized protein (DUF302 family)